MAEVLLLPNVERYDIGHNVPVERVLELALAANLDHVIIVGRGRDGFYLASSSSDNDRSLGLLARASSWVVSTLSPESFNTEANDDPEQRTT